MPNGNEKGKSMKNILKTGAAAAVIVSSMGTAVAQTTTTKTTYSNGAVQIAADLLGSAAADKFWNKLDSASAGSRYQDSATVSGNTEGNSQSVANSFTMTGNVTKDCSFYGGGTTAHDINLGTIGVRTGNNDNVSQAFNQRDQMTVNVNSATAGCNFNNTVTIATDNAGAGLLNKQPGGYDPAQFTDRIPYSIEASWTGSLKDGKTTTAQTLKVAQNVASGTKESGAWRSTFDMDVTIPAQSKALVAGTYSDKITVTLATI